MSHVILFTIVISDIQNMDKKIDTEWCSCYFEKVRQEILDAAAALVEDHQLAQPREGSL